MIKNPIEKNIKDNSIMTIVNRLISSYVKPLNIKAINVIKANDPILSTKGDKISPFDINIDIINNINNIENRNNRLIFITFFTKTI